MCPQWLAPVRYRLFADSRDAVDASRLAAEMRSCRFDVELALQEHLSLAALATFVHGSDARDRAILLLTMNASACIDSMVELDELLSLRRGGHSILQLVIADGNAAPSPQHRSLALFRGGCLREDAVSQLTRIEGRSIMDHSMTTTTFDIAGHRIVRTLGVVRGLVVRSTSVVSSFFGGVQAMFGGRNAVYTDLCDQTRADAFAEMIRHAEQVGATAVVGIRFDASDGIGGGTEVLCYGTAVQVERCA